VKWCAVQLSLPALPAVNNEAERERAWHDNWCLVTRRLGFEAVMSGLVYSV
jgi:hypothetical protein